MQNTLLVFDKSGSVQSFTSDSQQTFVDMINEAADILEFFETSNIVGVGVYVHDESIDTILMEAEEHAKLGTCPTGLYDPVFAMLGYETHKDTVAAFCVCDTLTKTLHGTLKKFVRAALAKRSDYQRCNYFRLRMVENTQP